MSNATAQHHFAFADSARLFSRQSVWGMMASMAFSPNMASADGIAVIWGQDDWGQLNHPNIVFRQINLGYSATVGIDLAGNLHRWSTPPLQEPFVPPVFVQGPFKQLAGRTTICALREDGEIAVWASGSAAAECGITSPPPGPFTQVSAGIWHAAALRGDGSISCWGCSHPPWNGDIINAPPIGAPFLQIACGDWNTHAVRMNGSLASAGYSWDGANGCPSGNAFVKVAAGWGHGLALRANGTVAAWGRNIDGECVVPPGSYVDIAAGDVASMGLRTDGSVAVWGRCAYPSSGVMWSSCAPPQLQRVVQLSIAGPCAAVLVDACPADINQSGTIDAEDLAYVLFAWGMTGSKAGGADINGDAAVDANDLSLVLGTWGACPD